MAKKTKNNRTRRTRPVQRKMRNTRFAKARRSALRFSPYKPIDFTPVERSPKRKTVRRVRPQRTEKPKQGIKKLTPNLVVVHTQNRICKRRHERKQIIHALGKSGQGGQKKPDNRNRNIKC